MIEFYLAWFCFTAFIALLVALAMIDNKFYILPNKLVFALAILGIAFHFLTNWELLRLEDSIYGALAGAGLLLVIRAGGNYFLKTEDSVGLGDVKLMGAVGLWLGFPDIMLVFMLGGVLGVIHGAIIKYILTQKAKKQTEQNIEVPKLSHVNIPAGVGLAIATIVIFFYVYGYWWNNV